MQPFFEEYLKLQANLHQELEKTITGLSVTALNWSPTPDSNSLGVLLVHLTGAERYLIGDVVAQIASNRNRDAEFQTRDADETILRQRLTDNRAFTRQVLENLSVEDLNSPRIFPRDGRDCTVAWALLHALEHTALHVGHAQLTRQLWEQQK
jgi:hypothetical protein